MGCEIRRARYLSEISSVRELQEARRELEIREFFARERLEMDVIDTFSPDNLLAMVAPPGSAIERIIGSVGNGIATVQGIMGVLGSLFGGGGLLGGLFGHRAASRSGSRHAPRRVSHEAHRGTATRRRSPELEIEVELDPEPRPRSRSRR
jgi:hypothetical protein